MFVRRSCFGGLVGFLFRILGGTVGSLQRRNLAIELTCFLRVPCNRVSLLRMLDLCLGRSRATVVRGVVLPSGFSRCELVI